VKPTTGSAPINGAEIYYEVAGEGPPVVLVHAGTADSRMWQPTFAELAAQHRVVRYDLRGFGRSALSGGPFSHVADLAGLLDFLDIPTAALVGASYGGGIAIDFCILHPQRVSALLLAAPALGGWEWSEYVRAFGDEEDEALERGDVSRAVELNVHTWVDGPNRAPGQAPGWIAELVTEMQCAAFEEQLRADSQVPQPVQEDALDPPAKERLSEVRVPTLIIVGNQDVSDFLEIANEMVSAIPNARKEVVTAAHMVTMEQPDAFNRLSLHFLGGGSSSG